MCVCVSIVLIPWKIQANDIKMKIRVSYLFCSRISSDFVDMTCVFGVREMEREKKTPFLEMETER